MRKLHTKTLLITLSVFTLALSSACKKDEFKPDDPTTTTGGDEEVVEECTSCTDIYTDYSGGSPTSGAFLAAYPGSWWKFSSGDSLYCLSEDYYINDLTELDYETCERKIDRTLVHVPVIYGNYTRYSGNDTAYIYADSIIVAKNKYQSNINKQIDLGIGESWREAGPFYWNDESGAEWYTLSVGRKVLEFYESLEIPSGETYYNVVEIGQVESYSGKISDWSGGFTHLFYAEEIGLIWEFDTLYDIRERYLIDYHIAPH